MLLKTARYFFDASGLVKHYHEETGACRVRRGGRGRLVNVWGLSWPETAGSVIVDGHIGEVGANAKRMRSGADVTG